MLKGPESFDNNCKFTIYYLFMSNASNTLFWTLANNNSLILKSLVELRYMPATSISLINNLQSMSLTKKILK